MSYCDDLPHHGSLPPVPVKRLKTKFFEGTQQHIETKVNDLLEKILPEDVIRVEYKHVLSISSGGNNGSYNNLQRENFSVMVLYKSKIT